ncbi:MAG: 50S ribosomal protein L7 [Clostridia bacterium]|nr:50S ribosomal protein L7 [Clostridia bacterium]
MKELQSIQNLLGLARRSGKLARGSGEIRELLRRGQCKLVILASDSGGAIRRDLTFLCSQQQVPCITLLSKQELGTATGSDAKAAVALRDVHFADGILKHWTALANRKDGIDYAEKRNQNQNK